MNSTNNNSFEIAALKVFSDLYDLIKEDENIKTNKTNDKSIKLDLNNDILCKKNECLSVPICININDEEVEISKTLDRYSITDIISKYNKDLASEISKMNICKIEHPKTKKAYENLIMPLTKAFDNNNKYFNDKFKNQYRLNQDIVNIVLCHSLKSLWISIYYGSH